MQQTPITPGNRGAQIAPAAASGPLKTASALATVPTAAKSGDDQETDADTVAHLQRKISLMHVTILELQQQVRRKFRYLETPMYLCTMQALALTSVHPRAEISGRRSQRASQELSCKCT